MNTPDPHLTMPSQAQTFSKFEFFRKCYQKIKASNFVLLYFRRETYEEKSEKEYLKDAEKSHFTVFSPLKWVASFIDFLMGLILLPSVLLLELAILLFVYGISRISIKPTPELLKDLAECILAFRYNPICGIRYMEGLYLREENIAKPSLEIGISDGWVSSHLFRGQSFDFGADYLFNSIKANPYTTWNNKLVCSIKDLPFKPGFLGSVFSQSVIHHIPENQLGDILEEVSRILKPGGTFVFSCWGPGFRCLPYYMGVSKFTRTSKLSKILEEQWIKNSQMFNHYTKKVWEEKLAESGFVVEKHTALGGDRISRFHPNMGFFLHRYTGALKVLLFSKFPALGKIWTILLSRSMALLVLKNSPVSENQTLWTILRAKKTKP